MNLATSAVPAACGVVSHAVYFNRGEHHLYAPLYVKLMMVGSTGLSLVYAFSDKETRAQCVGVLQIALWYLVGVYSSLLTYRVLFHPLRSMPGPFGAKLSSLWFSTQITNGRAFEKILQLHQKHGDFVRIGSSDVSIVHPEGVAAVYSNTSKCVKGAWYDLSHPMVSLQTTREKGLHSQRRRVWSSAFSDKQLRGYEERMSVFRSKLLAKVESCAVDDTALDTTKWFNLYSFDVMGDVAFGAPFEMLDKESHWAIKILEEGMKPLSLHLPVWFFQLLTRIPIANRDWWRFIGYCGQMLDERIAKKPDNPDIMSTLLAPWEETGISTDGKHLLHGDSQLIIVAGSDTTAATMTNILYRLVDNPEHFTKLREELLPCVTDGVLDYRKIQNLEHLNAIVNETLRMHPPVPTALHRLTPPEGITVGSTHIPGGMTVWCPQYAIGRSEKLYPQAETFIPERWYSRSELVIDKNAFAPFSTGPYACIGKSLALQNMRNTISEVVLRFDISSGPNDDMKNFVAGTVEHFTLGLPRLALKFEERKI